MAELATASGTRGAEEENSGEAKGKPGDDGRRGDPFTPSGGGADADVHARLHDAAHSNFGGDLFLVSLPRSETARCDD